MSTRSERMRKRRDRILSEDDDSLSLAPRVVESESSAHFFPPTKRRVPMQAFAASDDDDSDDDEGEMVFSTARRTTLEPRTTRRVMMEPTPEAALVSDSPPRTIGSVIHSAQRRRTTAREAIEMLRSGALPHADNLESNVAIDATRFENLLRDSPAEYQSAYKPPWEPKLPPQKVAELQLWEKMEVLSELELMRQSWFSLVVLVAGQIQVPLSTLVVRAPSTASVDAVRPSRLRTSQPTSFGSALADILGPPPPLEPDFGAPPTKLDFAALRRGDIADPFADKLSDENVVLKKEFLPPQTASEVNDMLFDAVAAAASSDVPFVVQSGARFAKLRRRYEPPATAQVVDSRETADAHQWASRSTATGVYFLTPAYTSARDSAHAKITSRAAHLCDVPLSAFVRDDGSTTSAQRKVRVHFAELIGFSYNMSRHNSNRSAKLASDAKNYQAAAEDIVEWFIYRVSYDQDSRRFSVRSSNSPNYFPRVRKRLQTGTVVHNPFLYKF